MPLNWSRAVIELDEAYKPSVKNIAITGVEIPESVSMLI